MGWGQSLKRSLELKTEKLKLKMVKDNDKEISQKKQDNKNQQTMGREFLFCKMKTSGCITM